MKGTNVERLASLGALILAGSLMSGAVFCIFLLATTPEIGALAYLLFAPWTGLLLMLAPTMVLCWEEFRGKR